MLFLAGCFRTENGHVVTLAYWEEKEKQASDDIPYFENK
jgi:hypothetical protein